MDSLEKRLETANGSHASSRQYLFLYPVGEYIDSSKNGCKTFEREGHSVSKLWDMIDNRYRKEGYGINWLLFGVGGDEMKPDTSIVPGYVDIRKGDRILSAGVSFKEHTTKEIYADNDFVLDQLPSHNRLVLGGFHQGDCVDKIAERSYSRGVDTFIDEDTTELFFWRETFSEVPLVREKWSLKDIVPNELYKDIIESRKNTPWLLRD